MDWQRITKFLRPTKVRLLVTSLIVLAYISITLYQAILFTSFLSVVGIAQQVENERLVANCLDPSACVNRSGFIEAQLAFGESIKPYSEPTLSRYQLLEAVRTAIYPGSSQIQIGVSVYYPSLSELFEKRYSVNLEAPIRLSDGFYVGIFLMIIYFYVLSCVASQLVERLQASL